MVIMLKYNPMMKIRIQTVMGDAIHQIWVELEMENRSSILKELPFREMVLA